jgi:hypothetical protein
MISMGKEVEIPQRNEVAVNPRMQRIKKFLRPMRLENQPDKGSTIPLETR